MSNLTRKRYTILQVDKNQPFSSLHTTLHSRTHQEPKSQTGEQDDNAAHEQESPLQSGTRAGDVAIEGPVDEQGADEIAFLPVSFGADLVAVVAVDATFLHELPLGITQERPAVDLRKLMDRQVL